MAIPLYRQRQQQQHLQPQQVKASATQLVHAATHQHDATGLHVGRLQGAHEQLVVRSVDGVAALEGHHMGPLWQGGPHPLWSLAGEHPAGSRHALERTVGLLSRLASKIHTLGERSGARPLN